MITALLKQKYRNGRALRDHEIAHIMIALLMAGQHTSSASGSWTLLHLASRPEVAEALYQEQVKYFGRPDGSLRSMTFEELRQLPLLDCVIRETLRLHPPIHSLIRKVRTPIHVPPSLSSYGNPSSPLVIPAGNYVLACPAISQVDPLIWKDPLSWDPERWTDPEGVAAEALKLYGDEHGEKVDYGFGAVSKGTESPYQPFGSGRHRCIGEQVRLCRPWSPRLLMSFFLSFFSLRMCSLARSSLRLLGSWSSNWRDRSPNITTQCVFVFFRHLVETLILFTIT
jgi:sterol 14-demethylase